MATADVQALVPSNVSNGVLVASADVQAVDPSSVSDGVLVVPRSGGDERYEVMKVPAESASRVQDAKKKVLVNLKLESVLKDLNRVSDLLYLASLSLIGAGDLQCRILRRQSDLSTLYTEFVNTINGLQQDGRKVLGRLTEAYSHLLEAKEERAVQVLSKCAKNWSTMSTKLEELADGFKKMEDDTKEDAVLISIARGNQLQKNEALQKFRAEMEAQIKETKNRQSEKPLRNNIDTIEKMMNTIDQILVRPMPECRFSSLMRALKDTYHATRLLSGCSIVGDFEGDFATKLAQLLTFWLRHCPKEQVYQARESIEGIQNYLKKLAQQEKARRDGVARLAALSSPLLETNDQIITTDHKTATWALEIATQTLGYIFATLTKAKTFWDSKQQFCANLADPKVIEQIRDDMNQEATPEERIQYYKGDHFVPAAVGYLCEWSALVYICGEYVVRADHAGLSVQQRIKASPDEEEATKLLEPLKKEVQDKFRTDADHIEMKINAINAGVEEVNLALKKLQE